MKTNVRYAPALLLLVMACNRPDSDLFGDDGQQVTHKPDGASGSTAAAGASSAGSGATDNGDMPAGGGALGTGGTSPSEPSSGGSEPTGGSQMDQGSAGNPNPPDPTGMGGAGDEGSAGSAGMKPNEPVPVCGNGKLEAGEECDDAGHAGQDGCDENCKVQCAELGAGTLESEDHHCYNGYDQGDFKQAQDACTKRGAHLATISSAAENKLAQSFVRDSKWLGGFEDVAATAEGTGAYGWVTKEPLTFTNWAQHEPNRAQTRCNLGPGGRCFEHCISINGDGTWADRQCETVDGYVCEWEPAGN